MHILERKNARLLAHAQKSFGDEIASKVNGMYLGIGDRESRRSFAN